MTKRSCNEKGPKLVGEGQGDEYFLKQLFFVDCISILCTIYKQGVLES